MSLNSGNMNLYADFLLLRRLIHSEVAGRRGQLFTDPSSAQKETISLADQANALINAMRIVNATTTNMNPVTADTNLLETLGQLQTAVNTFSSKEFVGNDSGCSAQCVGLCQGCDTTCLGGCLTVCAIECSNDCTGSCSGTCTGGCDTSCTGGCKTTCTGGCKTDCTGSCQNGCGDGCAGNCGNACYYDCYWECFSYCGTTCRNWCTNYCTTTCSGTVKNGNYD